MRPVWLCPLRLREPRRGRRTRSRPATTYVNVGFWGTVAVGPGRRRTRRATAPIEAKVHELGGHKSLYSEAFYDRETFDRLYDGANLAAVKQQLRPGRPADRASTRRR